MKNFKNLLLLLASAFCLNASAISKDPAAFKDNDYIGEWGRLKLVGNQLSSESGEAVQLRGWSSFSTHFDEVSGCLTEDQFRQMKAWGANVVRMAMYLSDYGGYLPNSEMETVKMKSYIDWTANVGIYCMVDWHVLETTGGQSGDPHTYLNDAKTFFGEISSYVKSKGYKHVIYEICNEPDQKPWSNIKNYANALLPTIAENDPNAVVIVGTPSWDQQILDPVTQGKVTHSTLQIMYAFHYYACSHEGLLGNFSYATASIPVFVSEWSGVTFSGEGELCQNAADKLLAYCDKNNDGKQLVSWCFWNWGAKGDGSATFSGSCDPSNVTTTGKYIISRLYYILDPPVICCAPIPDQSLPTTREAPFDLGFYDNGGEGIAYHDENSETFVKNEEGEIVGYAVNDPANNGGKDEALNCNSGVSHGSTFRLGEYIDTFAYGQQWTQVPDISDNCVDLIGCFGPDEKNAGWYSIEKTEPGEWINYTINVEKAGYYKLECLTSLTSSDLGSFTLLKLGELGGCIVRDIEKKDDYNFSELKLVPMSKEDCEKSGKEDWQCWQWNQVMCNKKQAYVLFTETGTQTIKFLIGSKSVGDVGPLNFEWVEGIENIPEDDPLVTGKGTGINNVSVNDGAIYSANDGIISIYSEEAGTATISTVAGSTITVNIDKGDNNFNVAPGLYIVNLTTASNSKAVKVLVK